MSNTPVLMFAIAISLIAFLLLFGLLMDGWRHQIRRSLQKARKAKSSIPVATGCNTQKGRISAKMPSPKSDGSAESHCPVRILPDTDFVFQGQSTLLSALEEQQPGMVQGSCRTGSCGSCKVRLVKGQVRWLIQPEFKAGEQEILSCCCVPVGPVTLESV